MSAAWLTAAFLAAISPTQITEEWHGVLGYSERGRAIRVHRYGDFTSPRTILAVGCIHGDECEGIEITRRLARGPHPAGLDLWIVHGLNPDGRRLGLRVNGRGVDLNRNFGSEWRKSGRRWDPEYSGPRPWSERETRLARRLVLRARPDVTIWYHQPQEVVRAWGGRRAVARRYARLAGEQYRSIRWPNGTAPNWQNHTFPGAASFVVELPAGSLSDGRAARHARAVRRLLPLPVAGPDDLEAIAPDRPSASNPRPAVPAPGLSRRGSGPAARPLRRRARPPTRPAAAGRSRR